MHAKRKKKFVSVLPIKKPTIARKFSNNKSGNKIPLLSII